MMHRHKMILLALLTSSLLILFTACDKTPVQPTGAGPAMRAEGAPPGADYVSTPAGWYHRSCVHEIPNGAHVDTAGVVTRRDGVKYRIPKCRYRPYPTAPGPWRGHRLSEPTNDGWMEYAWDTLPTGSYYRQLAAGWRVPSAPTGSYSSPQVFYSFPGLESSSYIIQPVIQYGYSTAGGGQFCTAASWRCNSGSDCKHGPLITIGATDSIYGTVSASACVNGVCTWTITIVDVTRGTRSDWTADDTEDYFWSTGGAMEVNVLNSCAQYPANGVSYSGIALADQSGSVSPAWMHVVQSNPSPDCAFNVSSTPTTVSVYVSNQPLSVSIDGPSSVRPGDACTWTALVQHGRTPYTYSWSGILSGSDYFIVGAPASSGDLNIHVSSPDGQGADATLSVTVTPSAPACPMSP